MRRSIIMVGALLLLGSASQAQDKAKNRELKDRVKLEGHIVCIGCTLAKEVGANSQCTLHAKHALGFLDKAGKLWPIVDNARGHLVMTNKKLRDKDVRVFGWSYKKLQHLEIWNYELKKGKKWLGYDFCKT